jgi:hypothetical protein
MQYYIHNWDHYTLSYHQVSFQMHVSPCATLLVHKVLLGWTYMRELPIHCLQIIMTLMLYTLTRAQASLQTGYWVHFVENKFPPCPNSIQRECSMRSTHILELYTGWRYKVIFKPSQFYLSWESKSCLLNRWFSGPQSRSECRGEE